MRRYLNLGLLILMFCPSYLFSQLGKDITDITYRRSSLHTMLIESGAYPMKDTVENVFYEAPFPEKYNNHTVGRKSFDPSKYGGTLGVENPDFDKKAAKSKSAGNPEDQKAIENYLEQEAIARQMIAKWFNRSPNGSFDMSLIGERGSYNASEMEAKIAEGSVRGVGSLAHAGEELIKNTFVVVTKLNFVKNEPFARAIRDAGLISANQIENELGRDLAIAAAETFYALTKDGYTALAVAYLYQLEWDEETAAIFYQDYWVSEANWDKNRVAAFDTSKIFKMKFVGAEKASSIVAISAGKSMNEIIHLATIRNIDNMYVKLQKKYDVFKTKTPLYSVDPLAAKIGLKEGVKGGDKFEVLEQTIDSKTGKTKYVSKGKITVDRKKIWDNRYNAGEEISVIEVEDEPAESDSAVVASNAMLAGGDDDDVVIEPEPNAAMAGGDDDDVVVLGTDSANAGGNNNNEVVSNGKETAVIKEETQDEVVQPKLNMTYFKGGSKKYYPGMLIRQVK